MNINVVYFSCGRDQEMLNLSIDSLRRNYKFNKIFVASDNRDPVTDRLPDVTYIEKESSTEKLYGVENIHTMHDIFAQCIEQAEYIMKIDSDVLCCSDQVFRRLEENRWDCYGCFPMANEKMIPWGHFNGNAYFIKKWVVERLALVPWGGEVDQWAWMNYPEDMVTSTRCCAITSSIQVDWTAQNGGGNYLFDTYLTKVAAEDKETIKQYGFAHCRTNPRVLSYLHSKLYD